MTGALIILVVTALIGMVLWLHERHGKPPKEHEEEQAVEVEKSQDEECCGMHAVCEKQLLSPVSPEIEYFDDEELDDFAGRQADSYSGQEIEIFRDILLTMPVDEVPSWSRSLQLRGINLPSDVRDELLLIVREQRDRSL